MIKKLLPLLLLILIGCSEPEPLNYGLLVERDGVHYRIDTNEIYSGPVFGIDGGKSEGTLKKGKFHGPFKSYHPNGQLQGEGTFKDGKEDGPFKSYYKNGQLVGEGTYKDGKEDGPFKTYYSNGQLRLEETYKDGKEDGPFKEYHKNGQLSEEGTWKDGKEDGPYKVYHDNGQLGLEKTFKDGQLNGPFIWYDINGKIEYKGTYKDNEKWNGSFKPMKYGGEIPIGTPIFYENGKPIDGYKREPVDDDSLETEDKPDNSYDINGTFVGDGE